MQGHLNNAATVRLFNDLRVAYVHDAIGPEWIETIRRERLVVAAREVHVLYESEGLPGESFVGALRYVRREGKAAILEQRLVEAATGRAVARAWVVQLLVHDGRVVEWPGSYFAAVAAVDGREIPVRPRRRRRRRWGPPAVPSRRRDGRQAPSSVEHPPERVDRARHRGVVPLGRDRGADQLEVEHARVTRVEHFAQDARERDVAVAGYEPLRRGDGPDLEVAHLHQPDAVDAVADRVWRARARPSRR